MNGSGLDNFFFIQMWTRAVENVASGSMLSSIESCATGVVAVLFVLSVYESFAKGASLRDLLMNLFKFAVCVVIIQNWLSIFMEVSTGVSGLASQIDNQDTYEQMLNNTLSPSFTAAFTNGSMFPSLDILALFKDLIIFLVAVLCGIVLFLFEMFYTMWGLILLALGPIMVALYPSNATRSFTTNYLSKTAEWAAWPLLYAILSRLVNSSQMVTTQGIDPNHQFTGMLATTLAYLQSPIIALVYIILIILLPFVAHFIIQGDFAGTIGSVKNVMMMLTTGMKMGGNAAKALGGKAASGYGGWAAGGGGGGSGSGGGAGGGSSYGIESMYQSGGASAPPPSPAPASGSPRGRR